MNNYRKINCHYCNDMGVMIVKARASDFQSLMICHCEAGKTQTWKLPRWDENTKIKYGREPCPFKWFRGASIDDWKTKINQAIQQWEQLEGKNGSEIGK
jgi:hypothetical protein